MAANIKGTATAVKAKRGRPTKAQIAERKANEAAAQKAIDANGGKLPAAMKAGAEAPTGDAPKAPTAPKVKPPESAPAFGANRITEGPFLRHVQTLRQKLDAIEVSKGVTKALRGQLKDLRNLAKADGIVLGDLDDALEELETERVDLLARQERMQLYREWLGLPTLRSADTPKIEAKPAKRWNALGNTAGRLGQPRTLPDGIDGQYVQDWLHGWDQGQRALMAESDLTRDGFKDGADPHAEGVAAREEGAGGAGAAPEEPPPGAPVVDPAEPNTRADGLIVFREDAFAAGTGLEDANRKTLLADHLPRWEAAETVVALFDGKKRVLKEPASGKDEAYEDTGEPDAPISDPEPATAADLAAAGEEVSAGDMPCGAEPTSEELTGTDTVNAGAGDDEAGTFH